MDYFPTFPLNKACNCPIINPMKVLFVFIISLISISAIADSLPYDSNCVELGKNWNWIHKFDPTDPHKRSYAKNADIQKNFSQIEDKVIEQLTLWKDVEKYVPCLGTKAGIHFEKEKLVITDMNKFREFRLNDSKIDCSVTSKDTYISFKDINAREEAERERKKGQQVSESTSLGLKAIDRQFLARKIDDQNAEALANELRERMRYNNNLGDLGMENYCSHQLRIGIVRDEAARLSKDLQTCTKASESKNTTVLSSKICQGYPKKNLADINALEKEMNVILKDPSKKGWQPLVTVNAADNDVFVKFKNDYAKLLLAKKTAAEKVKIAHDSETEKFFVDNQMTKDIDSLKTCVPEENVLTDQFLQGAKCTISDNPLAKLVDEFQFSIKALKDTHQAALIDAINVRSYGEAIKAKYYLLEQNDPLKGLIYIDPQKACLKMIEEGTRNYACKGHYLEAFKKAAGEASKAQQPHFLSYSPESTLSNFNSGIRNLDKLCGFLLSYLNDAQRAQARKDLDAQLAYIQTNFGAYLYNENLGNKASLKDYRNEKHEYCPNFNPDKTRVIELHHVVDARKEFLEATDAQIKTSADFSRPDKGSHSNKLGAWSCEEDKGTISQVAAAANAVVSPVTQLALTSVEVGSVSDAQMKEKNNLYALNSLYHSHPYMVGKMLAKLPLSERKIYTSLICDAKKCNKKVEDTNKAIDTAAQVAIIAANFVPVAGQIAGVVAASALAVKNNAKATQDYQSLMASIATGGFETSTYDPQLQSMIDGLKVNAGNEALAQDLFKLFPDLIIGTELEAVKITMDMAAKALEIATLVPKNEMNVAVLKEIIKYSIPAVAKKAQKIVTSKISKGVVDRAESSIKDLASDEDLDAIIGRQILQSSKLNEEVKDAIVKSMGVVKKGLKESNDSSDKDKK